MKCLFALVVALAIITSGWALLGSHMDIDLNDERVKSATNWALEKMSENRNDAIILNRIKSAQYQVIGGIQYFLTLNINVGGQETECTITVVQLVGEPWSLEAKKNDPCSSYVSIPHVERTKRRAGKLLGGREDLDLKDPGVLEASNWAVDNINSRSNSMYRQVLQRIEDGSRQVVNGYKYRFLLFLITTKCLNIPKNSAKGVEDCPVGDTPMKQQCDVSVLKSQGEYSMLNFKCKPVKPILGGDDHDYKPHGNILGGDDHDYKLHRNILGGDDHDYKPHENILGGDDHDYKLHGNILGGDDHDYKPHGNMLGGDDHDYEPHGKNKIPLLGQDLHDYIPHLKRLGGIMNAVRKGNKENLVQLGKDILHHSGDVIEKMKILKGDSHHGVDLCQEHRKAFEEFKSKYQRLYASTTEEAEKFQIFCGNMERVKEYQKMERGSAIYGATKFADLSEKEFKAKYLGLKPSLRDGMSWPSAEIPQGSIPESWDWRDKNAVTPVKNQGSCGSCWAFSTTGNIEGMNAIKNKKLISLSEQELVDCDKIDEGCNGGLPIQAYKAIMEIGGLETEKDYSYDGEQEKCHFKKSDVAVKVSGAVNISKNEDDMAAWLYKNGPISIGINAFAMQFYLGGIAHPWRIFCNPAHLDHGVLIVGYGKQGSTPYWIIKNSWGSSWGREGYYYVYRGDGVCGLNTMCTSAIVK